mmetsp:Transcript_17957/g.17148  ORF Transcript_17957/g.17148 Transcript_17957/m.17148 type:complete len:158 (+) Transcript_17957:668-1141(+)
MKLRDLGKYLEDERNLVTTIKGWAGYRKRSAFKKKLRVYETRSLLAETEFNKLEMSADYVKKVEPMWYYCKLFLGICCVLMTLNMLGIISFDIIDAFLTSLKVTYLNEFINELLARNLDFVAAIIFLGISIYMLIITVKGNATIGYRIAFFTFYPVT